MTEVGSSVTLTLTTNDPDGTGPCTEVIDIVQIYINKAAEVDAGMDRVICELSTVNLNGSIGGSASGAMWSTSGDGTFSFAGDLNATYTPGLNDISNGGVTLTLTSNVPTGPCGAVSDEVRIDIDAAPTAEAGTYAPICIGDTIYLSGTMGGAASSITWSGGVGTFINPDQLNAAYIPDPIEQGSDVLLTITTDDPVGVCFAAISQTLVTINRLPLTGFSGLNASYQVDDSPVNLTGIPNGGIFYGPGIAGSSFSPAVADVGSHVVRYTYTDINGCSNFEDKSTIVYALPDVEIENPGPYCLNENPIDNPLPRTTTSGFEDRWSGSNVFFQAGEYYFNHPVAGVGTHPVTYTVEDVNTGAISNETRFIIVNDVPKVEFAITNNCIIDSIHFVDNSTLENGDVFNDLIVDWDWEIGIGPEFTSNLQNPIIKFEENNPDNYYVRLTATTSFNCSAFKTGEVEV